MPPSGDGWCRVVVELSRPACVGEKSSLTWPAIPAKTCTLQCWPQPVSVRASTRCSPLPSALCPPGDTRPGSCRVTAPHQQPGGSPCSLQNPPLPPPLPLPPAACLHLLNTALPPLRRRARRPPFRDALHRLSPSPLARGLPLGPRWAYFDIDFDCSRRNVHPAPSKQCPFHPSP